MFKRPKRNFATGLFRMKYNFAILSNLKSLRESLIINEVRRSVGYLRYRGFPPRKYRKGKTTIPSIRRDIRFCLNSIWGYFPTERNAPSYAVPLLGAFIFPSISDIQGRTIFKRSMPDNVLKMYTLGRYRTSIEKSGYMDKN